DPVAALELADPAPTLVLREKLASPALARPDPVSDAVQASETFWACQAESALAQLTAGVVRSTWLPVIGPAVAQLPATSQTWCDPVAAFELGDPAGTVVLSEKPASDEFARPEPLSDAVQASETFCACHAESAVAQLSWGVLRSTLLPAIGPAAVQLPATSHTWREPVAAF